MKSLRQSVLCKKSATATHPQPSWLTATLRTFLKSWLLGMVQIYERFFQFISCFVEIHWPSNNQVGSINLYAHIRTNSLRITNALYTDSYPYVHMCISMYIHVHMYIHIHMSMYIHTYTHVHTRTHTCMSCTYLNICTCMPVYVYIFL